MREPRVNPLSRQCRDRAEMSGIFLAFYPNAGLCRRRRFSLVHNKQIWGKAHGARTITTMAGYRQQRMAARGCNLRRPAKYSRADGSLWRHRQEEMGDQLRLPGDLRIRVGPGRLGPVRLQHGLRGAMVPIPRQAGVGDSGQFYNRSSDRPGCGIGYAAADLSDGDTDLLPVRVRSHHRDHPRRLRAWPHELYGLDDLLPGVDDVRLYGR